MWCLTCKGKYDCWLVSEKKIMELKTIWYLLKYLFRGTKCHDIFKRVSCSLSDIYVLEFGT
jgi:hypothetical protein